MPATRKWVKLWVIESLEGSIRFQLSPEQRGVWYDLLIFAALGSPPGTICDRSGRAYPTSFIAGRLNISEELLATTLRLCQTEGRINDVDGVIEIVNWSRYQSEYDRQRPYREAKQYAGALTTTEDVEMSRRYKADEISKVVYDDYVNKRRQESGDEE